MVFDGSNVASGNMATVGAVKETTYGTFESSPQWLGEVNNLTIRRESNLMPIGGIRDSRLPTDYKEIRYNYRATMEGELQNVLPIIMTLGNVSTSGASAPYTHTVSILRGDTGGTGVYLPSYSIHAQFTNWDGSTGNEMVGLKGAMVSNATFRIPVDDVATFTLELVAQDIEDSSVESPTEDSSAIFGGYNTDLLIDSDSASYSSGTSVEGVEAVEISFDNNLTIQGDFNQKTIRRPFVGSLRENLTGRINRKYIDTDLTALADGTPFSFRAKMSRGTDDYVQLTAEDAYVEMLERSMSIDNAVENTPIDLRIGDLQAEAQDDTSSYS